jgi:hypothetical protein
MRGEGVSLCFGFWDIANVVPPPCERSISAFEVGVSMSALGFHP